MGRTTGCGSTEWHGDPGSLGKRVSKNGPSLAEEGSTPSWAAKAAMKSNLEHAEITQDPANLDRWLVVHPSRGWILCECDSEKEAEKAQRYLSRMAQALSKSAK